MEELKQKIINIYSAASTAKLTREEHDLIGKNTRDLIDFVEKNQKKETNTKKKS